MWPTLLERPFAAAWDEVQLARVRVLVVSVIVAMFVAGCSGEPLGSDDPVSPRRSNVVVFVLDAARADRFGAYGHWRDTTPRIDAFGRDAMRYETVLSEASYTFLSTSSLLSAASPAETGLGARRGGRIPASIETLAETASAAGYATWGYSENPYVTAYFGMHQGFDFFEEAYPKQALETGAEPVSEIDTSAALDRFVASIAAEPSRPFFFYAHVLRPHNPYAPPPPFAGRFGSDVADRPLGATASLLERDQRGPPFAPDTLDAIATLYDENLAYGDALFGQLIDALEAEGLLDETVVVLTADHGDAFGEHGRLLHSTQLFDEMLRIPLFVRVPGTASGVESRPVQLADLGRGLARVLRGEAPDVLLGLAAERAPRSPLFSWTNAATGQLAAWTPSRRLLLDLRRLEVAAYYDLAVDPDCRTSIPLDEVGEWLAETARAEARAWMGRGPPVSAPRLDPARRAQLEALGYLDP